MSTIDFLWLAHLNRNIDDAGSDSTINLTINTNGDDILDTDFEFNVGDGEADVQPGPQLEAPFDSTGLTNYPFASACGATMPGRLKASCCLASPRPSSIRTWRCRSQWQPT